jgi:hypothetical protein
MPFGAFIMRDILIRVNPYSAPFYHVKWGRVNKKSVTMCNRSAPILSHKIVPRQAANV